MKHISVLASATLAACGQVPPATENMADPSDGRAVLLTISHGRDPAIDPIHGAVVCEGELDPLCVGTPVRLAEAVLLCGPDQGTIDQGWTHVDHVHFPAGLHERFPQLPTDLDIVRCVQGRVGFRFSAAIIANVDTHEGLDQRPFRALHAEAR